MNEITSERVALLRAAFFRYAAQRDRRNATAGIPVEQRGRFGGRIENTGSGDWRDVSPRSISTRATEAPRGPVNLNASRLAWWAAQRGPVGTIETGRGRVSMLDARSMRRTPTDHAWALWVAGLIECHAVESAPGVVRIEPRHSAPTHATADHLAPAAVPDAATFTADRSERVGRASSEERYERVRDRSVEIVRRVERVPLFLLGLVGSIEIERRTYGAPHVARVNVPAALVAATAADPGAWHTEAAHLSGRASRFLAAHGEAWPTPDAWNRNRSRYHSRPDRVAHRGTARVAAVSPVRYERKVSDATAVLDGRTAARTGLAWHVYCQCGEAAAARVLRRAARFLAKRGRKGDAARSLDLDREARKARTRCACVPTGWVGHKRVTFDRGARGARAARRIERASSGATAARGPAVSPWSASSRNLARTAARVAPVVATFESILRTAALGVPLTFDQGTTVTVLDGSTVEYNGRAYPVREWSRRAALAGIDPAAIG